MRSRFAIAVICVVLSSQIFAVACSSNTASVSTNTIATAEQILLDKIASALNQAGSYKLDSDVTNHYTVTDNPNHITSIYEWKGSRLMNVTAQEMSMSMTYTEGDNLTPVIGLFTTPFEMYFKGGYTYLQNVLNGPNNVPPWSKSPINEIIWERENQISTLSEVLSAATGFSQSADENIDSSDCYVLNITSTVQAMIDLVLSQQQPYGPTFNIMFGGGTPVVRPDAYKSGSVKLWIDKDGYLPLKVVFNIDFQGFVGGESDPNPRTPTINPIDSSFQGQLDFSNFNQPVTIEIPQAVLDTTG